MRSQVPITVLMSVYNGEDVVSGSIASILGQTFSDFEFLIIDDGSTDNSFEIIHSFARKDSRIVPLTQENIGLTRTLNKGLKMAAGMYIARQDAGDYSLPERLKIQKDFLDRHPAVALVGTSLELIDEQNRLINRLIQPADSATIKKILVKRNCFSHGSMMFRKKQILELGGYREQLPYAQDYDLALRVAEEHDLINLKEVLYRYSLDGKAISVEKTVSQRLIADYIKKLAGQRRKYGKDDIDEGRWDHIHSLIQKSSEKKNLSRAYYFARIAHEYSAGGNQKQAIHFYIKSLKSHPSNIKNILLLVRAHYRLLCKSHSPTLKNLINI